MKIVEHKYDNEIILALGMFDSVHRGHKHLISKAQKLSEKYKCKTAVFTFKNNPYAFFGKKDKMIFAFDERIKLFEGLGVDIVIAKTMNEEYALTPPICFLENIFSNYNVKTIVCGSDYTFGYKGKGNIAMLTEFANNCNIDVEIIDFITESGKKISSSTIKDYILNGDIENANKLMGHSYFIDGQVICCYGRGKKFGYPTANMLFSEDKLQLQQGVYATSVVVDGKEYASLTNVGTKPTFDDYALTVESFLINFDGDLYGKSISVKFFKKIRNIIKFNDGLELYSQIMKDLEVSQSIERLI